MILPFAIISIFLALIFYSINIFLEIKKGFSLKSLIFLWLGLAFDLLGTALMFLLVGHLSLRAHSIVGIVALILMAIKAVWSTGKYKKGDTFGVSKIYTVSVYILWVAVFFMGMALNR